jgi:hypothetical protein
MNQIAMLGGSVFCVTCTEAVTAIRKPSAYGLSSFTYFERYLASQEHSLFCFQYLSRFTVSVTVIVSLRLRSLGFYTVKFGRICCLRLQGTRSIYPDNGESRFLGKVDASVPNYTGLHPFDHYLNIHNHDSRISIIFLLFIC